MSRGIIAAVAASVLLAVPAAAGAAPVEEVAAAGDVRAVLRYEVVEGEFGEEVRDLRFRVERAGAVLHDAPVVLDEEGTRCEGFCRPANALGGAGRAVLVRDLDGDAVPEAVLRLFTGGAHCCALAVVVRPDGAVVRLDTGSVGYRLARDGLVVTGDVRFDSRFSAYAGSAFPVQLLRLRGGRFVDVTRAEGRSRVRRDARVHWRAWRRIVRRGEGRYAAGVLAAWTADRYRLGARRSALRTVRAQARRAGLPRRFAADLDRQLRAWGYAR